MCDHSHAPGCSATKGGSCNCYDGHCWFCGGHRGWDCDCPTCPDCGTYVEPPKKGEKTPKSDPQAA